MTRKSRGNIGQSEGYLPLSTAGPNSAIVSNTTSASTTNAIILVEGIRMVAIHRKFALESDRPAPNKHGITNLRRLNSNRADQLSAT
jgi:hypothetical protein